MKNLTAKTIQTMIALTVFVVSATSFATEPPPYALFQGDDVLNLHQFGKYLEERFDEMDNERSNAKYDMRRMVDRNNIDNAHPMRILQAIGKVTKLQGPEDTRDFQKDPKSFENKSWSTGTMISPYHMITNKHAVCNRELTADGEKRCIKTENLIGKEIHFSFGEKKDGSDFDKRVTGKVIASNSLEDFAILRIDSLKDVKDVPYVRPNFSIPDFQNLHNNVCLGAGFPIQSKNESNHKIYAMKAIMSANMDFVTGKMTFTPGNSGSPVICEINGKLSAMALFNSSNNDTNGSPLINGLTSSVSFAVIGASLEEENPQVLEEITTALKNGRRK